MAHLILIANTVLIVIVSPFLVYTIGAAIIFGMWHQFFITAGVFAVLLVIQIVLAMIAEG